MAMIASQSRPRMPPVRYAGERIDLAAEARKSRRRLYPVSIAYSLYASVVLGLAWRSAGPGRSLAFSGSGLALWTAAEYMVHRHVLHGRFSTSSTTPGPGTAAASMARSRTPDPTRPCSPF
jgi:hypothetical protein